MPSTVAGKGRAVTKQKDHSRPHIGNRPPLAETSPPVGTPSLTPSSPPVVSQSAAHRSYDDSVGFDTPEVSDSIAYRIAKRTTDIIGGMTAIALLSPFMIAAAILIKLQDGGPIVFSQRRVGRGGRLFTCYKFRTMVTNADAIKHTVMALNHHHDHRTFKVKRDPRVTRVGLWLRRLSIDEFPQLWNVLKGEMTLVGPRPPVPGEVALYTDRDMRRLEVKPGLTCLWQISGRGDLPFDQQIVLDLEYIDNRGVLFDFWLLVRTVPVLLTAKGAY